MNLWLIVQIRSFCKSQFFNFKFDARKVYVTWNNLSSQWPSNNDEEANSMTPAKHAAIAPVYA